MPVTRYASSAAVNLPSTEKEHLVLIKQLARLQRQMTAMVNDHAVELQHWQRRLMRQSVRLILERTRAEWNIRGSQFDDSTEDLLADRAAALEADLLICQAGCVMDGFHWRDGVRCKRTDLTCHLIAETTLHQEVPASMD